MNGWHTVVISDVHIGSPFFRHELFLAFLDTLRPGTTVVFNGDTIDNPRRPLSDIDQMLVGRIEDLANRCTVVWLPGNHDTEYRPCNSGAISYQDTYTIGDRLLVAVAPPVFAIEPDFVGPAAIALANGSAVCRNRESPKPSEASNASSGRQHFHRNLMVEHPIGGPIDLPHTPLLRSVVRW